jgi:hypothetical protein
VPSCSVKYTYALVNIISAASSLYKWEQSANFFSIIVRL